MIFRPLPIQGQILARRLSPNHTAYWWDGGWYAILSDRSLQAHAPDLIRDGGAVRWVGYVKVHDLGRVPTHRGRLVAKSALAARVWRVNEWLFARECRFFELVTPDTYPEMEPFSYKKLAIALIRKLC